ncbi:MAG TPA: DUF6603 domain-containing protein [Longimicrobium sp.]|jgi:hypothetical protein
MDLSTLQSAVAGALSGSAFSLASGALGGGTTGAPGLLASLFGGAGLQLTGATANATASQPTAHGTLGSAPQAPYGFLAGMAVDATFSLDEGGTPQVQLRFTPAKAAYGLADAVPALGDSVLSAFTTTGARFSFDTADGAGLSALFPAEYGYPANSAAVTGALARGMRYHAAVTYAGQDPGMRWLVGGDPVAISGPVEWLGTLPRFDLASATLGTRGVGPFGLPVALHLVSLLIEPPPADGTTPPPQSIPLAILAGQLGLPSSGRQLAIPYAVEVFSDPPGQVRAVGRFADASSLALQDVAGLLGVSSLDSQSSSGFPVLQGLALQTLALTVDLSRQSLLIASATVAYTPPGGSWAPFGDVLVFQGLSVTFNAIGPLSSPTFNTSIAATATLSGGQLGAEIQLPSLELVCELQDGSPPIDLTALLASATGGSFGSSFQALCTRLRVLGSPSSGQYRLQATVSGANTWGFDAAGARFALSSVGFDLTVKTGAGGTTGQVVAQLIVAGTPVQLSASYLGAGVGWSFAGGTLGTQNISLTDLAADALAMFGLKVPSTAPQVVITGLQMMLSTASMDFGFSCDGQVTVLGRTVDMGIDLGRTHDDLTNPPAVTTTFNGYLTIGGQTFTADFTTGTAGSSVLFRWTDADAPLGFADIASFFGFDLPALPEGLNLGLKDAELYYDFTRGTVVASAHSTHYGQILFASLLGQQGGANAGQRIYLFSLDVPLGVELSDLPVVGDKLPAGLDLGIQDLQVIVASAALPAADVTALNGLMTGALGDTALIPATLGAGLTFAAKLQMGGGTQPIVIPLTGGGTPPPQLSGTGTTGGTQAQPPQSVQATPQTGTGVVPVRTGAPPPAYQAGTRWFPVEKTFGPVTFQRIGVQYDDGRLFILLDASFTLAALSLSLQGLGIGSPLTSFSPRPHLDGIGISFSSGPVTISGALLVVPTSVLPQDVDYEYMGQVTVAVEPWLISAVAAYASVSGSTSFFLFAQVNGSFGGPPAFFVTGVMGGFGVNSRLTLPAPDQVYRFPFLAGLDDPSVFGPSPTPMQVLDVLSGSTGRPAVVTPSVGDGWLAAGITFRSFELVLGRALLVVEIGHEFQVALMGLASTSFPQGATTDAYAYVQLQLMAVFKPDDGFFSVAASLTPGSFVLTQACRLTGGFAFCLWFGPSAHAGDFVVTVGGYHPAFQRPQWYPVPAPVGFNWQVSGSVTIKGGAYFAITPSAVMAGGSLEVLYQSGSVRAWFTAYANLLITWKPFHFRASVGISLGASVRVDLLLTTVTLSFEVGATLDLWGPPTGGVVTVHLYVISFSVSFGSGSDSARPPPLDWKGFSALLPQGGAPQTANLAAAAAPGVGAGASGGAGTLDVQVNRGLSRQDDAGTWYVRGDELVFSVTSAVPATSQAFGGGTPALAARATAAAPPSAIAIRPMGVSATTSAQSVTLTFLDENEPVNLSTWTQVPQTRNLPEAMWGAPVDPGGTPAPSAATIPNLLVGAQLQPPPAVLGASPGPMDIGSLVNPLGAGWLPLTPGTQADPIAAPVVDANVIGTMATTLASPAARDAQQGLIAALAGLGAAPPTSALLTQLAQRAGESFSQAPLRTA